MTVSSARHGKGEAAVLDPIEDPSYPYPRDEFDVDDWVGPTGAHRAARKGWLVALPWLVGALVALMLTGIVLLFNRNGNDAKTATAPVTKSAPASASQSASVTASATSSATASGTTTASVSATSTATASASAPSATATRSALPAVPVAPSGTSSASPSASATTSANPSASTSPSASATTATGVVKTTRTQILNATRRNGLAHQLQSSLNGAGWNVVYVGTYRVATPPSTVYYRNEADKATAQALADLYGVGIKQSQAWKMPITLMIGDDFKG